MLKKTKLSNTVKYCKIKTNIALPGANSLHFILHKSACILPEQVIILYLSIYSFFDFSSSAAAQRITPMYLKARLNRVSDYIKGGPYERHSKINEHFECGIPSFIDSKSIRSS
jgi:hypothetical protein